MSKILFPSQKKYLQKFNREEDSLILEMEKFASEKKIPILCPESALFLEQLVLLTRHKRVLEIGTAIAYSSIRMARHLRKKGIIHTIEKSEDNIKLAIEFVKRSGYDDKIKIIAGDGLNLLPTMNKKYDLIFLDADKKEYKTSTKLIREFNKLFTSQANLKTSILPIGDGIGLGIKI